MKLEMLMAVRNWMARNKYMRRLIPAITESKPMQYWLEVRVGMPLAQKEQPAFQACYEAHKSEFEQVLQMLEDDFSRKTLETVISYRLTPRRHVLGGGAS